MDDIAGKISELLSSPDGMDKIKTMANALFASNEAPKESQKSTEENNGFNGFSLPDGFDISKIMGVMSALNSHQSDHRSELLLALKPHLSKERSERVDKAVKLLKIVSLLPLLREQGLLDIL